MKFAITSPNGLIFGPSEWNPQSFQTSFGDNGFLVSLPCLPPEEPVIIGELTISKVEQIIPQYDNLIERVSLTSPIVSYNGITVTETYIIEAIPATIDPQTLKSLDLKKAENNYCIYMNTMAQTYGLTLTPDMTRQQLLAAASTAGLSGMSLIEARQTIMELLNDVNVNGGRYGDIAFHPEILGQ